MFCVCFVGGQCGGALGCEPEIGVLGVARLYGLC